MHLRKPISFIWKVRGKANDKYNLLFFQFSCRSNYTLAILLQFISCQTHPTEKTCRAMRFIFYPVLRVTVRIDMDQYHFIFFAVTYILMHLMKKTWNLQIAFLQFFCIMEVRGGGTCLWRYPEHPDSSKAGFTAFERPKDREPRSGDCENQ